MSVGDEPLVVTVELDPAAQDRFEHERRALFPAGRTAVGAHLTLFHAVPAVLEQRVRGDLAEAARTGAFAMEVTGVYSLGHGVAYRLAAPELDRIHRRLQQRWWDGLTRQDRQPLRAHVTVQNKVATEEARATLARLRAGFRPFPVQVESLRLWRYEGGPWTPLRRYPLRAGGQ